MRPRKTKEQADLRQQAETPAELFSTLHSEYGFDADACANENNHKLTLYWNEEQDALLQSWRGLRLWCNPPYNNIEPWLRKGLEADLVVYLLPNRTDSEWFHIFAPKAEIHWFRGRIQFKQPPGVKYSSNSEGSLLFILSKEIKGPDRFRFTDGHYAP